MRAGDHWPRAPGGSCRVGSAASEGPPEGICCRLQAREVGTSLLSLSLSLPARKVVVRSVTRRDREEMPAHTAARMK